ncbi:hypothetical protein R3P38DRAFT_2590971 [Favolaschia claudopus]|uniref:Uncharacterized protein n=1 Tax=Favolaschia claudopus TaxID=2862362 RepID=A0AAV9YZT3_9AGAR
MSRVARWALPNGQIVRSVWKESRMLQLRIARNVKVRIASFIQDDSTLYAEVQFFFQATINGQVKTLALISVYSPPNPDLLAKSFQTVAECDYFGDDNLQVIQVPQIRAGVVMIPIEETGKYFVAEKLGLDIECMAGMEDEDEDEDN